MSRIVLLNDKGVVVKNLPFDVLPNSYVVPNGRIVRWETIMNYGSLDPLANFSSKYPPEAIFFLGAARGQVFCDRVGLDNQRNQHRLVSYDRCMMTVMVSGVNSKEVTELRDGIFRIIYSGEVWKERNLVYRLACVS